MNCHTYKGSELSWAITDRLDRVAEAHTDIALPDPGYSLHRAKLDGNADELTVLEFETGVLVCLEDEDRKMVYIHSLMASGSNIFTLVGALERWRGGWKMMARCRKATSGRMLRLLERRGLVAEVSEDSADATEDFVTMFWRTV